jgi:hypothetical protein
MAEAASSADAARAQMAMSSKRANAIGKLNLVVSVGSALGGDNV